MRLGIVTTVRDAGPMLASFIAYHVAIGFERLFLFFDDPTDPDVAIAARFPQVTVFRCDDALLRAQRHLRSFPALSRQLRHVCARQALNAALGMQLAAELGLDWLLHLDHDELFHSPVQRPADHFAAQSADGVLQATYLNLEAVPEALAISDPFVEVTLFKQNPVLIRSRMVGRDLAFWQNRGHYFTCYDNGKSATRVDPSYTAEGPHSFQSVDGPLLTEVLTSPAILHYPNCGLARFQHKYAMMGGFPDDYLDGAPIGLTFHLAARDRLQAGDLEGFQRLYEGTVMLANDDAIERQCRSTILKRVLGPSRLLKA